MRDPETYGLQAFLKPAAAAVGIYNLGVREKTECSGEWTDVAVEFTMRCWADGMSATEIAERLALPPYQIRKTRNAVIGKIHRVGGVPTRVAPSAPPKRLRARPRQQPSPPRLLPIVSSHEATMEVIRLDAHRCRWPIGEPGDADFRFCGSASGGRVYCSIHAALAYVPYKRRRKDLEDLARVERPARRSARA